MTERDRAMWFLSTYIRIINEHQARHVFKAVRERVLRYWLYGFYS